MTRERRRLTTIGILGAVLCTPLGARAEEAVVPVGTFAAPPRGGADGALRVGEGAEPSRVADASALRFAVGPTLVTTGQGAGVGAMVAADLGKGSVGGRLYGAWNRGEGTRDDGRSTATGDAMSQYGLELTVNALKDRRIHPLLGVGVAALHVSRPDGGSGFAGAGTFRGGVEMSLGLEDADVRVSASVLGGLVGPSDREIRDLTGYVMPSVGLVVGL